MRYPMRYTLNGYLCSSGAIRRIRTSDTPLSSNPIIGTTLASFVVLACAACTIVAWAPARADVVIDWSNVAAQTLRSDTFFPGPTWGSRNLAIVHAAIYDAVNSIDRTHQPYHVDITAPPGASREAAAVQAAYRTLVSLYPAQKPNLDIARATSLAAIPNGSGKAAGITLGDQVGNAMIAWRNLDGAVPDPPYTSSSLPGHWRPDPLHPGQHALGSTWGSLTPFTMDNVSSFRAAPPPSLTDAAYTTAFNEVKALGAKNSLIRTPEQTEIGLFWGYDRGGMGPPPILFNQILQTISAQNHNSLTDNARLFALANLAMADAGIACWDGKYLYDFWRPITAIREADTDGNPLTDADPSWEPLGAPGPDPFTPPFPAYASGHATFGAAFFRILADWYGTDDMDFTIGSDELPGVYRTFHHFSDATEENGESRIYLGIHWDFDKTTGIACGDAIADHMMQSIMAATPEPGALALMVCATLTGLGYAIRCRRHYEVR